MYLCIMEIGDTVCNVNDYSEIGEIKGYVLKFYNNNSRVKIALSNRKHFLKSYSKYFALTRIVLIEKIYKIKHV